jgi:hypothetical protein
MFENSPEELPITQLQEDTLKLVTHRIMTSGLAVKYSKGLYRLADQRDRILHLVENEDDNDPHVRLIKGIFGSPPRRTMPETFFGIRVDEPLDGETDIATHYSIVQVDPINGVIIGGCDVLVGSILNREYIVDSNMIGIFTLEDLSVVSVLGNSQLAVGFNPRLG